MINLYMSLHSKQAFTTTSCHEQRKDVSGKSEEDDQTGRRASLLQSPLQRWVNSRRSRGHPELPYRIPTPL